jgi:hypothetical protein
MLKIYIFVILYDYVKYCKCKKIGEEKFCNVFYDRPIKWHIAKPNHQNIHPQLINLDLQESVIIKDI